MENNYIVEITYANGETLVQMRDKQNVIRMLSDDKNNVRFFKVPELDKLEEVTLEILQTPVTGHV